MIVTLQTAGLQTLAQVRAFVEGNAPVSFTLTERAEKIGHFRPVAFGNRYL